MATRRATDRRPSWIKPSTASRSDAARMLCENGSQIGERQRRRVRGERYAWRQGGLEREGRGSVFVAETLGERLGLGDGCRRSETAQLEHRFRVPRRLLAAGSSVRIRAVPGPSEDLYVVRFALSTTLLESRRHAVVLSSQRDSPSREGGRSLSKTGTLTSHRPRYRRASACPRSESEGTVAVHRRRCPSVGPARVSPAGYPSSICRRVP